MNQEIKKILEDGPTKENMNSLLEMMKELEAEGLKQLKELREQIEVLEMIQSANRN